ncbi:hypothetical protein ACOMHN_028861 [Nucella lapillus]
MTNNSTSTHPEPSSPFVGESMHIAARAVLCTLGTLMILFGVTGSGLFITVIFRRFRRKRHVHDLFLASLTLADLLILGYWLSFMVWDLMAGYNPVANQSHCVVNAMIVCALSVVCVLSLLGISLNRYLHVCHSQLCQRFFTLPRTLGILATIWTVTMLLALPPALGLERGFYHYSPHTHICSFSRQGISYAQVMAIFFLSASMVVIGACNFAIFRFWRKGKANLETWKDKGRVSRLFTRRRECVGNRKKAQAFTDGTTEDVQCQNEKPHVLPACKEAAPRLWKGASDVRSPLQNTHAVSSVSQITMCHHDIENCPHTSRCHRDIENLPHTSRCHHDIENLPHTSRCHRDIENLSQTLQRLDKQWSVDKLGCAEGPSSSSDEGCLTQVTEEGQGENERDKHCQDRPMSAEISGSGWILSSGNKTKSTSEDSVAQVQANSSTATIGKNCSQQNQQKPVLTQDAHTVHQQKKKENSREVACVRSLFIVWLLTVTSFIPYVIIMIVSSVIPLPSEVLILGILLLFSNNSMNWIVYGVVNPSFRKAYRKCGQQLLGMCCQRKQGRTGRQQTYTLPVTAQTSRAEGKGDKSSSLLCSEQQSSV